MSDDLDKMERDRRALELYEKVLEIEQRLIPTGLHVFGRPPQDSELADLLIVVASFDRPELGIRSLPNLVAHALGFSEYTVLLRESGQSEHTLREREQVEAIVRAAVERFIQSKEGSGREQAAAFLTERADVPPDEALRVFDLLESIRVRLGSNNEMSGLSSALRGEYVQPGPGADIVQNPDILPTGRNTHAINPYSVPSITAVQRAEPVAES